VLQVVPRLDLGGVERGALDIARAVVEAGGRALIASAGGRMTPRLAAIGAEWIGGPFASKAPWTLAANARRLEAVVREAGVDVVHARSRAPAWSAMFAARRAGAAFVTTWHGVYSERGPLKRRYNSVMAQGRPVIAVSAFVADLIRRRHRTPPERIVTIPRGVDVRAFSEDAVGAERAIAAARAWGLTEDSRPVVILPARLSRWKGQALFIEAAARLKARRGRPDFLCLLVGVDAEEAGADRLLELAAACDALDVVRLAGRCDDMAAAYKLAWAVAAPSTEPEAFGRVAVEAQAMARPVVASDHGGARETVAPGSSGWLPPPGDVEALTAALEAALALTPEARAAMGAAGRARVVERYTLEAMAARTLAVYERAAGRSFEGNGRHG
jgi:glycosyltransferase involved in cell wall biosynthesis